MIIIYRTPTVEDIVPYGIFPLLITFGVPLPVDDPLRLIDTCLCRRMKIDHQIPGQIKFKGIIPGPHKILIISRFDQ